MSSRESVEAKAGRYLLEGRLVVRHVVGGSVRASCRGGGAVYELGFSSADGWWCSCPAHVARCAHLVALELVVSMPEPALELKADDRERGRRRVTGPFVEDPEPILEADAA